MIRESETNILNHPVSGNVHRTDASETGKAAARDYLLRRDSADDLSDVFIDEILKNPKLVKRPSEIPRLSNSQVLELVRNYAKISRPSEKKGILWALAFSQNDLAFDTLRYAVGEEYAGQALSKADTASQFRTMELLGVLAASSDRAWAYLQNLTLENAWNRFESWSADYLTEQYNSEEKSRNYIKSSIRESVYSALGTSGRPEFLEWAEGVRSGDIAPPDNLPSIAPSICSGVFASTFIQEHGYSVYYDDVLYFAQKGTGHYSQWSRSGDGKLWSDWWQRIVTEAASKREKPN